MVTATNRQQKAHTGLAAGHVGALVFVVHAVAVALLISLRDADPANHRLDDVLHVMDFWVYNWVVPLFNRREMAGPIGTVDSLLRLSFGGSVLLWEGGMLTVFGGPVYAGLASLWRSRHVRRRKPIPDAVV